MTGRCERSDVRFETQAKGEEVVVKGNNSSSSTAGEGTVMEEIARYGFTPPQIPMDAFFPQFGGSDANGTFPNPFVGNPIATSLAIVSLHSNFLSLLSRL